MPKPVGDVHVLIAGESPEYRLPQHTDERMPAVLASAGVGERFARHRGKTGRVVELALGEQSRVRYDRRSTKLEHQAAVKAEPQNIATRFIHRVRHDGSINGLQC